MGLGRGPPRLQVQSTADLTLSHSNLSSSGLKLAAFSYSHYSNDIILKPHSNDGLEPPTKFMTELITILCLFANTVFQFK